MSSGSHEAPSEPHAARFDWQRTTQAGHAKQRRRRSGLRNHVAGVGVVCIMCITVVGFGSQHATSSSWEGSSLGQRTWLASCRVFLLYHRVVKHVHLYSGGPASADLLRDSGKYQCAAKGTVCACVFCVCVFGHPIAGLGVTSRTFKRFDVLSRCDAIF